MTVSAAETIPTTLPMNNTAYSLMEALFPPSEVLKAPDLDKLADALSLYMKRVPALSVAVRCMMVWLESATTK